MSNEEYCIDDYYVFGAEVPCSIYCAALQEFRTAEHTEVRELIERTYKETSDSKPYVLVEHRLVADDNAHREACEKEFLLNIIDKLIDRLAGTK